MTEKFEMDDLAVFDEAQRQVLVRLLRHVDDQAETKAKAALEDMGLSE